MDDQNVLLLADRLQALLMPVIENTIEKKVNGKVDKLTKSLDAHIIEHREDQKVMQVHMKKVEPILEAYQGTKIFGGLARWVGSLALILLSVWLAIKQL